MIDIKSSQSIWPLKVAQDWLLCPIRSHWREGKKLVQPVNDSTLSKLKKKQLLQLKRSKTGR